VATWCFYLFVLQSRSGIRQETREKENVCTATKKRQNATFFLEILHWIKETHASGAYISNVATVATSHQGYDTALRFQSFTGCGPRVVQRRISNFQSRERFQFCKIGHILRCQVRKHQVLDARSVHQKPR
jgi:hypothetical protein